MGQFGALAPFGLLTFGYSESNAEPIYRAMVDSVSPGINAAPGTHAEASIYARAIALASARATLRHAYDQRRAMRAVELLPALERSYGLVPLPTDSPATRRRRVAARKVIQRGSTRDNLLVALRMLLGDELVGIYVQPVGGTGRFPADPSTRGAWDSPESGARYFRLLRNVVTTAVPTPFEYENLLNDGERLREEDVVSVQPENPHLAEAITITNGAATGALVATAVFQRAHDAGAIIRSHAPLWIAEQRSITVVVKPATAADASARREVDELMRRLVRASTQWSIVEVTAPGTIGPLTIGVSRIGATPLGTITL